MYTKSKFGLYIANIKRFICTLLFLLSQYVHLLAQHQAHFNNLTEKDGLSNNRVTCFYKDKIGYMWIGTESGLNLYNGNSWKIYKPSPDKKKYLSNSFITDIKQDEKGSIWVCTHKGLNRIDMAAGTTEVFLPGDSIKGKYILNDLVWNTYPDNDTSIWIAADSKEFCRYNPVEKKFYYYNFKAYLHNNNIEINAAYHSIFRILSKSPTELWLATTDGIFSFNKQTGEFKLQTSLPLSGITFFYFDEQIKKLYFTDDKSQLYSFDPYKKEKTTVSLQPDKYQKKYMPPYQLENNLLFVPAAEGLASINDKNEVQYFLRGTVGKENDLLPGKVNCIYKDRQHITWVGTMNGVSKFIPVLNNNLNLSFENDFSVDPDLTFKNFTYQPLVNEWLFASWKNNKIFAADNNTGIITELQKPIAYGRDTCYAFFSCNTDSIFMLCKGSLLIYNYRIKKWNKIRFPAPYNTSIVTCMAIDGNGNYWLSNIAKHLFIYNPQTQKISKPSGNNIAQNTTRCLAWDGRNNCIWIGTSGYGLLRYNFSTNKFTFLETNNKNTTAIHSYVINEILPDGKGNIWVATFEGGLAKYNTLLAPDKGFTNYDIFSGLPDDNVYSVAVDKKGGAWFTTINGIGHIDSDGNWKGLYNQQNGLPYSKFRESIMVLQDGTIAAVTEKNFICFNPSSIIASNRHPVTIDDIFVNDTITVSNDTLSNPQKFNYTQNAFIFNFSALDFISPGAVAYYYMLEGQEIAWVFAKKQHSIRYSKLPSGEYTFKVKAKRENGSFYEQVASFHFYIRPPFWKTWWFISTCILLMATAMYWLYRTRINTIRHEAGLKQKIAAAEMQALQAQMNPHFIFNCLNAIDNMIQTNQKELATTYLSRFARLIRGVLDSSKNNLVPLHKDVETLKLYLQLEQFRCNNKFEYSFIVDEELMHGDYKIPPLVIQPFLENAIHHGLLNKEQNDRKLEVMIHLRGDDIHYTISDNGVGRGKAAFLKELNKPEHVSYGIQISKDRINMHNQDEAAASVTITDLFEGNEPAGTRVQVIIKGSV